MLPSSMGGIPAKRVPLGAGRGGGRGAAGSSSVRTVVTGAAARRPLMGAACARERAGCLNPYALFSRARSARAPGARWATEDSAGPRPAPRAPGLSRRPARCFSCGNVQIRGCGRSARSARGGRPLPSRKDAPPRMRSLYRYTLCKRKVQQRADTARPPVAPVHALGLRGAVGKRRRCGSACGKGFFGRRGEELVPLRGGGKSPFGSLDRPGRNSHRRASREGVVPGSPGPSGPGCSRGGAATDGGVGTRSDAVTGFYHIQHAPPDFGRRVSSAEGKSRLALRGNER